MKQIEKNGRIFTEGEKNERVVKCKGIVDGVKHNIVLDKGQGTLYISKGTYEYLCNECYQTRNNKPMKAMVSETLKTKKEKKLQSDTIVEFFLNRNDIRIAELIQTGHAVKNYGSMVRVTSPAYPNLNGIRNAYRKMGLLNKPCTVYLTVDIGFNYTYKGTIDNCLDDSITECRKWERVL